MKKIAADKNYRMLKKRAQDYDAECAKKIEEVKSDGYYPLKAATFWNADGDALIVFQRNDDLRPAWYPIGGSKADQKELLDHALNCLKTRCARGSQVSVKSDPNIKMMSARALTEEDIKEAFIVCA